MTSQPEHISAALQRALDEVEMRPMPCPPRKMRERPEDGHRFAPVDDEWQRCVRCGWYARR